MLECLGLFWWNEGISPPGPDKPNKALETEGPQTNYQEVGGILGEGTNAIVLLVTEQLTILGGSLKIGRFKILGNYWKCEDDPSLALVGTLR